ncbi:serpin family protein [Methanoculleus sp.]|uniref:serpin family protein n=1 Tax=Methanoculleus sp. TaxID=90427 RepID=UPI002FC78A7E
MKSVLFRAMTAIVIAVAVICAAGTVLAQSIPSPAGETPDDQSTESVVAGNNRFACDLYRQLASDPEFSGRNIFFSPYSISSALAVTYEGARGTTADEIRSVLHFPANATRMQEGFAAIDADLNQESDNYTLRTANALWAEETYPFLPAYVDTASRWYGANVTNLDFKNDPDGSRRTINRWVEKQTEEKIRDLLQEGMISPLTRLVITNAIYFKGTWSDQFERDETTDEEFRVAPGETVTVRMMQQTDGDAIYAYAETATLQAIELPYVHGNGTELSMLVLLPKGDNLTALETHLDAEWIADIRDSLDRERVDLFLPKFRIETTYSLRPTLAAMGMATAFSDDADLSGMDGTGSLLISEVIHKTFVNVTEEGTEAAAATAVIMMPGAAPEEHEPPVFRADHPFIFLIQDDATGNILFMGRVTVPGAT